MRNIVIALMRSSGWRNPKMNTDAFEAHRSNIRRRTSQARWLLALPATYDGGSPTGCGADRQVTLSPTKVTPCRQTRAPMLANHKAFKEALQIANRWPRRKRRVHG
ncbi:hypothetical protein IE4872_PA00088 (plasmid) [Rhizobium gallicum]|uniref:Uncharacterized protein n=1 Tax=Rhizobium gallicum TaxID=56730 RepID=A0A1L5NPL9_9HYPH|nr:hypothetical protein IE4872_PA00088 [Rhizobium gallicum]